MFIVVCFFHLVLSCLAYHSGFTNPGVSCGVLDWLYGAAVSFLGEGLLWFNFLCGLMLSEFCGNCGLAMALSLFYGGSWVVDFGVL